MTTCRTLFIGTPVSAIVPDCEFDLVFLVLGLLQFFFIKLGV